MRLLVSIAAIAVAVVLLLSMMFMHGSPGGYRVLRYASKSGDLYCVDVHGPGKYFLLSVSTSVPLEVVYVSPIQLFSNVKLVAVSGNVTRTGINIVVVDRGLWNVYVVAGAPGTYCFRIVTLR